MRSPKFWAFIFLTFHRPKTFQALIDKVPEISARRVVSEGLSKGLDTSAPKDSTIVEFTRYPYMNEEISSQKAASAGEPISDSKPRKWKSKTSRVWRPKVDTAEQSRNDGQQVLYHPARNGASSNEAMNPHPQAKTPTIDQGTSYTSNFDHGFDDIFTSRVPEGTPTDKQLKRKKNAVDKPTKSHHKGKLRRLVAQRNTPMTEVVSNPIVTSSLADPTFLSADANRSPVSLFEEAIRTGYSLDYTRLGASPLEAPPAPQYVPDWHHQPIYEQRLHSTPASFATPTLNYPDQVHIIQPITPYGTPFIFRHNIPVVEGVPGLWPVGIVRSQPTHFRPSRSRPRHRPLRPDAPAFYPPFHMKNAAREGRFVSSAQAEEDKPTVLMDQVEKSDM